MTTPNLTRRTFLKASGALAALFGIGGTNRNPVLAQQGSLSADDMDKMHEASVKAFLDNIGKDPNFWGVMMPYTLDGSTKVFHVTATEGPWETQPGTVQNAMLYNARVPGEIIRVTEGDKVRVVFENKMSQSSAIHFHGLHTPNPMDGVPFITQPVVKPGASFIYEFVAKPIGSHMYHAHHSSTEQVTRGLLGAFIVDPADKSNDPRVDGDYMLVLNDSGLGFSFNGKSFPATQPISAKLGDRIRIRYFNEGLMIHPMHLHGMYQQVIAKDGAPLSTPYLADTLNIAPGERYDVLVECQSVGVWAFHCHILSHAEGSSGMYGMVTVLIIK